jgi:hypothetical protein
MKKSLKSILFLGVFVVASYSVNALADKDGCTPAWAPFWSTSCNYTAEDANGELVMYTTTCHHLFFTTKCSTKPAYDI